MNSYNAIGLSDKMKECLFAISGYMEKNHGQSPTLEEISTLLLPKISKGAVWQRVNSLKDQGYVELDPNVRRNIRLTEKALTMIGASK